MILTRQGEVPVETLGAGDQVVTVDRGFRPLLRAGQRSVTISQMIAKPYLRPIRIARGALGFDLPFRPLLLSPHQRCLIRSSIAAQMVGDREVLIAARHLAQAPGIAVVEAPAAVTYVHLLFDQHELVFSEGAITGSCWAESGSSCVATPAHDDIGALFSNFEPKKRHMNARFARQALVGELARKLVTRVLAINATLVEHKTHEIA